MSRPPAALGRVAALVVCAVPFGFLALFALFPLLDQAYGSAFAWHDLRPATFSGVADYRQLFAFPGASSALLVTVRFVAIVVPLEVALGLGAAWCTRALRRLGSVVAAILVVPLVVPWPAAAMLFLGLFANNGVVNAVLARAGVGPIAWLQQPGTALCVLVVLSVWKGVPWCYLLLLGALQACPAEIFEAARVDGARGLRFFSRIVIPSIRPMFVFVVVFRLLAEAQNLSPVLLLTQGGPLGATALLPYFGYEVGFTDFQFGAAAALGTLLGAALVLVAIAGLRASRPLRANRPWPHTGPFERRSRRLAPPWWPAGRVAGNGTAARWRGALIGGAVFFALTPLIGGLPSGAEVPDTALPWRVIGTGVANSAAVALVTVSLTLLLALPGAMLLARRQLRFRRPLFMLVLGSLAVPGVVVLLPQYQLLSWFGLIDSRLGLVLLYVAANLPLAIFFLRPAFAAVPRPLVEAMRVDGAGRVGVLRHLVLPVTSGAVVAVVVLVTVQVWNELPLAVTVLNSPQRYTLPVQIALDFGGSGALAASWVAALPPLALFIAARRPFFRGALEGSLL